MRLFFFYFFTTVVTLFPIVGFVIALVIYSRRVRITYVTYWSHRVFIWWTFKGFIVTSPFL